MRKKAVSFLQRGWCSVYLLVDEREFEEGHIKIEAYFTLSHKTLIPADATKARIKDAAGFKGSQSLHFVLIGQFGKYIEQSEDGKIVSSSLSSKEILDNAFEVIRASSSLIPCRCVLVECSDNEKVHKVYQNYQFKFFQNDGDHYQFYRRL